MAVVFPTENDKRILLDYIKRFHFKHEDGEGAITVDISGNFFQAEDIRNLECACDSVLLNMRKISTFFTAGKPLVSREIHDSLDVEDVEPFPSVSIMDAFSRQSPSVFFNEYRESVEIMKTELLNSRDTMKRINAANAFIWTTNVSRLQQWFCSVPHQDTQILTSKMRTKVAKESMLESNSYVHRTSQCRDNSTIEGHHVGHGANGYLSDTFLLSLKAEKLPSEIVKSSYAKFIQACASLISWLNSVLDILNGVYDIPKPGKFPIPEAQSHEPDAPNGGQLADSISQISTRRTHTVTVRCFEIHDAYQIYALIVEQAAYFFQPACTQYDARVQRRLLQSSYFHSVRELIDELTIEINRLKKIARQKPFAITTNPNLIPYNLYTQRNDTQYSNLGEQVQVFFRPPLSYFYFLRASLQLYLSICLNEDDLTSLSFFQHLYKNFLAEARDVIHNLQRLPGPSLGLSHKPKVSHNASIFLSTESEENSSSRMVTRDQSHYLSDCGGQHSSLDWMPSVEERGQLYAEFEAYWTVYEKVLSLRRILEKDIRSKDSTHRTRMLASSVQDERGPAFLEAEQRLNALGNKGDQQPASFWTTTKNSLGVLSRILTCQAEVDFNLYDQFVGNVDGEGTPMTATSPYHDEKTEILKNVTQLWKAIEIQGAQLEKKYPNHFFIRSKSRWSKFFKGFAKKVETVSVVFET
ncbi:unnamed protein product [Phytomonas sp. EM1]|nr:unnamed protein product [Phytomonas sp. EM1]|eukprot:CCW64674.1 unnamed protein product [Phytomonas sp. isolate EM1]